MKAILFSIAVLLSSLSLRAQSFKKASLQAAGLTCAMCSNATLNQLKTLPFVDKIDTDLNTTTFILHFKSDVPVNFDLIRKKVEDAGFSVAALKVTAEFNQVSVKADSHIKMVLNHNNFKALLKSKLLTRILFLQKTSKNGVRKLKWLVCNRVIWVRNVFIT
jgi:cation transport ATPase